MPGFNTGEVVVMDDIAKFTISQCREEWDALIRHTDEDALDRRELRELAFLSLRLANGE